MKFYFNNSCGDRRKNDFMDLEKIKVGDDVVVVLSGDTQLFRIFSKVKRTTETLVILENGRAYRKSDGEEVGDSIIVSRICIPTEEEKEKFFKFKR